MASFGLPLQLTFAAATQQAIDLVRANRLTIGTSPGMTAWRRRMASVEAQAPSSYRN